MFDLKKVWRGEIDLTITFWVWGVLVANVLLDLLLGVLIAATENQFLVLLHRIFVIVANAFVVVAVAFLALLVAAGIAWWAKKQIPDLLFAATVRQLRKDVPSQEEDEHGAQG